MENAERVATTVTFVACICQIPALNSITDQVVCGCTHYRRSSTDIVLQNKQQPSHAMLNRYYLTALSGVIFEELVVPNASHVFCIL